MKKIILTITILAQAMPWFMEYQKEPTCKGQVKEVKEYYPVMREESEYKILITTLPIFGFL
jgi:hypothetical protein